MVALILVDLVPGATGTQRLGWDISSFHIFQRFLLATVTGEVPMDFGPGCLTLGGGPVSISTRSRGLRSRQWR